VKIINELYQLDFQLLGYEMLDPRDFREVGAGAMARQSSSGLNGSDRKRKWDSKGSIDEDPPPRQSGPKHLADLELILSSSMKNAKKVEGGNRSCSSGSIPTRQQPKACAEHATKTKNENHMTTALPAEVATNCQDDGDDMNDDLVGDGEIDDDGAEDGEIDDDVSHSGHMNTCVAQTKYKRPYKRQDK
jgi:hypothetical protein